MNQIENRCGCGRCFMGRRNKRWYQGGDDEFLGDLADKFCPHCGYRLGDDGIARRTVVVPEKLYEITLGGISRFFIPVPQEGEDE